LQCREAVTFPTIFSIISENEQGQACNESQPGAQISFLLKIEIGSE
jgi:hypothetical protein